ncbi:MAG: glycerol-3-phosphate 1-O-acyltransferase PlsY [Candidatus Hydrogenedentes bacterium]|nr:glycerol-3-phosphate 1-O-acyltransferase PlsY [Candidatus Hydrogenedentota bacterium]
MTLAGAVLLSYLLGSIPTGLWLGRTLRGVDIREHGSKNIGATNTMRVLGKSLGALALAGDMGKGLIAVAVVARISPLSYAPLACGLAAIVGHTISVFCRFRGGKGVATAGGAFLGLCPIPTAIAIMVFAAVVAVTRMVSAGSIAASIALITAIYVLPNDWPLRVVVTLVGLLVIIRHRSNIQRILRGEENKV